MSDNKHLDLDFEDLESSGTETPLPAISDSEEKPKSKKKPGRKKYTRQITALMYETHVNWLNNTMRDNKRKGGNGDLKRANLLRALVQIAMDCNVKISKAQTEDDIKQQILDQMRGKL